MHLGDPFRREHAFQGQSPTHRDSDSWARHAPADRTWHFARLRSTYRGRDRIAAATRVSFSSDGESFSPPRPIELEASLATRSNWLWRVTWNDRHAYGVLYQTRDGEGVTHLVTSTDGRRWRKVTSFDLDGRPNEATLRFLPDGRMVALVRREGGDQTGCIGSAEAPYDDWQWHALPIRLGGPELVVVPRPGDRHALLAVTRAYGEQTRTIVARVELDGSFLELLTLPSAGDTSYAGAVVDGERLAVSYYSSHEGRTAVYLATLRVDALLAAR